MSSELDSRRDSNPARLERRPRIMVKLNFRELCDSNLSGLRVFYGMAT